MKRQMDVMSRYLEGEGGGEKAADGCQGREAWVVKGRW